MNRRDLLLASGAWASLAATGAGAQPKSPRVIGWFSVFTRESQKDVMHDFGVHLARLGHLEGRDFVFEGRWSDGRADTLPALARELVATKPAVLVTAGTAAIEALKGATSTIPIVFMSAGDPVLSGFVASLARPGGNITGAMLRTEITAKLFELVREILPAARRVAVLEHDRDPIARRMRESFEAAARALRYELLAMPVADAGGIEGAFGAAEKAKAEAVIVPQYSLFLINSQAVGALALKTRIPLFSTWRGFTAGGGLLSYYSDFREALARSAAITDKILRGANPAGIPVEQPDRYTLVVNAKTAAALGVRIPQSVLIRADEVIE